MPTIRTERGYDFYECTSAMQKAIRRGDAGIAGYFALELVATGYAEYVWKRLLTVSAEDCYGETITTEVYNLFRSFRLVNEGAKREKGRIFISKAVIILARTLKSRDADHLQCLIYDPHWVEKSEVDQLLQESDGARLRKIPEYALDIHTRVGRMRGKTKAQFFTDEFAALEPRQPGLFDGLVEDL